MSITIRTSQADKEKAIRGQLALFADDLIKAVKKQAMGFDSYDETLENFHCLTAQRVWTWNYLTEKIITIEREMDRTPCNIDDSGNPTGLYEGLCYELDELTEETEDWYDVLSTIFDHAFTTLDELFYGEGD